MSLTRRDFTILADTGTVALAFACPALALSGSVEVGWPATPTGSMDLVRR